MYFYEILTELAVLIILPTLLEHSVSLSLYLSLSLSLFPPSSILLFLWPSGMISIGLSNGELLPLSLNDRMDPE